MDTLTHHGSGMHWSTGDLASFAILAKIVNIFEATLVHFNQGATTHRTLIQWQIIILPASLPAPVCDPEWRLP